LRRDVNRRWLPMISADFKNRDKDVRQTYGLNG
jgi:hypothetical protein